jgi:tetratricopeptide (TPR) repeat protein
MFQRTHLLLFGLLLAVVSPLSAQDHYPEYMQMALVAYNNKSYDLAISYYHSALEDKPGHWPAYQGIGSCYYMKGNKKAALKAFEKALKINPRNTALAAYVQALRRELGASP